MNDINAELHNVKCIKNFTIERKTTNMSFRENEEYKASKINDNWWLIDQIGIKSGDFKKYFKDI